MSFDPWISEWGNPTIKVIPQGKRTRGTEISNYPEERTSTETPLVVTSERGPGQWPIRKNRNRLERRAIVGDSPVRVKFLFGP